MLSKNMAENGGRIVRMLLTAAAVMLGLTVLSQATPFVYVTDLSGSITVIDASTNEIKGTLDPPVASSLSGTALNPATGDLYALDSNKLLHVIESPNDNPSFSSISLPGDTNPFGIVVSGDGNTLYIANAGGNTVTVVDVSLGANTITSVDIECDSGGTNNCSETPPIAISASLGEGYVYIGTETGFAVIDAAGNTFKEHATTTCGPNPCPPMGLSTLFESSTVFVSLFEVDEVLGIEAGEGNLVTAIAEVGANPIGLAVMPPDGDAVYVTNLNGDSVSAFEVSSCSPMCTVSTVSGTIVTQPSIIAITTDGSRAYVGGEGTSLSVIDTSTNAVTATVSGLPAQPFAIAISTGAPGLEEPGPGPGPEPGDGSGNGGGGCSLSPTGDGTPTLPLYLIIATLILMRRMFRRAAPVKAD